MTMSPLDPDPTEAITDRQLEVARLIYLGRTNGEIADVLDISLSGAKHHVSELLGRLGMEHRENIGAWYSVEHRSMVRERLAWMLSPVGALAAAAAAAAILVVGVTAVAVLNGGGPSERTSDGEGIAFVDDAGAEQMQVPGVREIGRYGHTSTRLPDGRVVVIGGRPGPLRIDQPFSHSIEIFDPAPGWFDRVATLPVGFSGHDAVVIEDGPCDHRWRRTERGRGGRPDRHLRSVR